MRATKCATGFLCSPRTQVRKITPTVGENFPCKKPKHVSGCNSWIIWPGIKILFGPDSLAPFFTISFIYLFFYIWSSPKQFIWFTRNLNLKILYKAFCLDQHFQSYVSFISEGVANITSKLEFDPHNHWNILWMHTKFCKITSIGGATRDACPYLQNHFIYTCDIWCTYTWPHLHTWFQSYFRPIKFQ